MQILFSWKNEKNISKCRLLKILPRVLGVMVCTNKSRIGLCMAKPTIKLVRRDGSACTLWACTSVVWSEPSLIILPSTISGFNKTSCATSKDSCQSANCTFWQKHSLVIFTLQCDCNSTFRSDPSLIVQYAPSSGYPRSLLFLVGRCRGWPESLLVARTF